VSFRPSGPRPGGLFFKLEAPLALGLVTPRGRIVSFAHQQVWKRPRLDDAELPLLSGPRYPHCAIAEVTRQETLMSVRTALVLVTIAATTALAACRKEVPHKPMKLGGDVPAAEQVKR
jgi:hypothetical protein